MSVLICKKDDNGLYILPERFEYLNVNEPFSWAEVLRDFVLNKVQSETIKKKTVYYYYCSEGIIYTWNYDRAVLMVITSGGSKVSMDSPEKLAEQAFFKVKQLY